MHSLDGYDEISLTSPFMVSDTVGDRFYIPQELGFEPIAQADLHGGTTVADAARIFDNVLAGTATRQQLDCVTANAAFALRTLEPELSVADAIGLVQESIASGAAAERFRRFVELNGGGR